MFDEFVGQIKQNRSMLQFRQSDGQCRQPGREDLEQRTAHWDLEVSSKGDEHEVQVEESVQTWQELEHGWQEVEEIRDEVLKNPDLQVQPKDDGRELRDLQVWQVFPDSQVLQSSWQGSQEFS